MSSKIGYTLTGMLFGLMLLAGIIYHTLSATNSATITVVVALAVIYTLTSLTLASFSIAQHMPKDTVPLGPTTMLGWGVLALSMWGAFLFVLPGLPWAWLLPVDEQGGFDVGSACGLDMDAFEVPHHD